MMRLSDGSILLQPVSVSVGTTAVVDWALQQMLMESSQHLSEAIEFIKQSGEGTGNRVTVHEDKAGHIDSEGYFTADTPENRGILEDVSNNSSNHLGSDKYGNEWYGQTRADGSQVWTQVRSGKIINGGVNKTPKVFNDQTGLKNSTRGW